MANQTHSFHQARSDLAIGVMTALLYALLALLFFLCLSLNNVFLLHLNRTTASTLLTFSVMIIAMHAVYGGFDVGRKKSKPVISAMITATTLTDLVSYLQMEIMNVCMAEENDYLETHSGTFYPGVEKTFLQLKQEGYKLYIVSNCQDGYIQVMMKNGGLEKDITDFESNGRTGKFKADNICLVLERNGIPKEAAVYVGDTPMDEIATREAGLRFIHAAYGYGKAEAPDAVIGSIRELPEVLREMKEGGKF